LQQQLQSSRQAQTSSHDGHWHPLDFPSSAIFPSCNRYNHCKTFWQPNLMDQLTSSPTGPHKDNPKWKKTFVELIIYVARALVEGSPLSSNSGDVR
jgi:hypothetical protein